MNDANEEELREKLIDLLNDFGDDVAEHINSEKTRVKVRAPHQKKLMQLIKAYGLQQQIESLKGVKGCFANLQDAEEAVYIESSYIDPRIATLTALKKGTGTSNE